MDDDGAPAAFGMPMLISKIDDRLIHCGWWQFDRVFGYEVDELLGHGVPDHPRGFVIGTWISALTEPTDG